MAYTPRILNEADDYTGIRTTARLDKRQLSDKAIGSPGLLPAVESKIIIMLPGYAGLGTNYKNMLRSAVTKITAAWALQSVPEHEKSLDYDVTRDRDKQVAALLLQAEDDLGEIPALQADITPPDLVRLAGPTRTKKATTTGIYAWIYETSVIV